MLAIREQHHFLGHFSLIATDWFHGSALEPTELQALLAESSGIRVSLALRSEAESPKQFVPRQSPASRKFTGYVGREVSFFQLFSTTSCARILFSNDFAIDLDLGQKK